MFRARRASPAPVWLIPVVFAGLYAVFAAFSLATTQTEHGIALIWPSSGVLFAGLLLSTRQSRLLLLALIAPATSAVPPAEAVPVRPPTLVRWSFWVPPQRMAEFAPGFDADIAPLLEKHGLTDPQPDTRVIPDSLFNRVYAVPSRQAFEAMRDSTYADPAFWS